MPTGPTPTIPRGSISPSFSRPECECVSADRINYEKSYAKNYSRGKQFDQTIRPECQQCNAAGGSRSFAYTLNRHVENEEEVMSG